MLKMTFKITYHVDFRCSRREPTGGLDGVACWGRKAIGTLVSDIIYFSNILEFWTGTRQVGALQLARYGSLWTRDEESTR